MKVAVYTRVSTDRQNHDSQLAELLEYCARRGWDNPEVFSDTTSGIKSSRTGLDRLMQAVRRRHVDAVVCFKLDRLGRSLSHLVQTIDEFKAHRVALLVPGQGIDTSEGNPAGQLQMHILCAVAEFEREIIKQRVNAGLAAARARGVRLGRPTSHKVDLDEVARLRALGFSGRSIARTLGAPTTSVLRLLASLPDRLIGSVRSQADA